LNKKRKQTWLKVDLNQLVFPTSALGSEFTRISYDITKVDPKYQVWSQVQGNAFLKYAFLEDVISNPNAFEIITSYDQAQGFILNQTSSLSYAGFLDDAAFPKHAFRDPRPNKNWVSNQTTRKILVVQVCEANFEDTTTPVDPALGYRPLVKGKSQPILLELSEDVAPVLGGK